ADMLLPSASGRDAGRKVNERRWVPNATPQGQREVHETFVVDDRTNVGGLRLHQRSISSYFDALSHLSNLQRHVYLGLLVNFHLHAGNIGSTETLAFHRNVIEPDWQVEECIRAARAGYCGLRKIRRRTYDTNSRAGNDRAAWVCDRALNITSIDLSEH